MRRGIRGICGILVLSTIAVAVGWPAAPAVARSTAKAWDLLSGPVDDRFGVVEAWRRPSNAADLRVRWERLTFQWSTLQPHGPQDWNAFATGLDRPYDAEIQAGRNLVGLLLSTPEWAAALPHRGGNSPPKGLNLPWNDPHNYWGNFVYQIVKHYMGKVDDWVVWNEVNIASGSFHTWDGTLAQYAQLVRVAYLAAKAANPHARIALYGDPYWYDRGAYFRSTLNALAALPDARDYGDYFDIAVLHLYSRPKDMAMVVDWYRRELARHGLVRPIWINETNSVPRDDPLRRYPKTNFNGTMDDQASFIVQAMAIDLAIGVDRIEFNRMLDGPDFAAGGEPFGLVRNDGSLRPVYYAFKTATHLFAGVTDGQYLPDRTTGVYQVILHRAGLQITVVWDQRPVPVTVSLPALGSSAYLVDKFGNVTRVRAAAHTFKLTLARATDNSNPADPADFVVGGSPLILVQQRPAAAADKGRAT